MEDIPGIVLLDVLGRGGRSVVRRGRRGERDYAVKVVETLDDTAVVAFRREAAVLACLSGADVPMVRDVGRVGTRSYLVMDLVDGLPLRQVQQTRRMTPYEVARLAVHLCGTLAVAHRAGLVHRDVSPDNILVRTDATACLIDFGLACRSGAGPEDTSAEGLVYASPERTGGLHRPVDARSDLYSLGVVMYELLAGRPPFDAADPGELIRAHLSEPVPPLAPQSPGLPSAMDALVCRLLAKDPDDRYPDAEGVADELERIAAALHPYTSETAGIPVRARLKPLGSPEPPPSLVGRDGAWYRLTERLNRAGHGFGGVVLVTGPSGIGKTRLAEELAEWAARSGSVVLTGRCLPGDAAPLGPVRSAVDGYLAEIAATAAREAAGARARLESAAGEDAGLLRALSPTLGRALGAPALVGGPGGEGEQRFLDAVVAFLTRLADTPAGGVLYLDDVHHADSATLRLLQRLAPALQESRLMVVLTVRAEPTVGPGRALIASLGPALDTRIDLASLPPDEVAALIGRELGGLPVDDEVVEAALERSAGNPLLVAEFLRAVLDAGLLVPTWDGWRMDSPGMSALDLPDNVTDLLVRQLHVVDPDVRRVLSVAAVTGARFSAGMVADICAAVPWERPLQPEHVSHALTDGMTHQLVVRSGPTLTFVHQRIRWALLADLEDEERQRLHRAVADHLTFAVPGPADPERVYAVARHLSAAGPLADPGRTFAALLRAGTTAVEEYCPTEALQFLREAEEIATRVGLQLPVQLHAATGAAAVLLGDHALADARLGIAAALTTDPVERVELVCQQVHARQLQGRGREAMELVDAALADLGRPQPAGRALVPQAAGWVLAVAAVLVVPSRWRRVRAGRGRCRQSIARLALDGATAAALVGDTQATAGYYLRALRAASRLGPGREYSGALAGGALLAARWRLPRLARRLAAAAEAAAPGNDPAAQARVAWLCAAALDLARPLCDDYGERMVGVVEQHGRWLDPALCLLGLGARTSALVMRGLVDQAEEVLERGRRRHAEQGHLPAAMMRPEIVQVAAVAGHATLAQTCLEDFGAFLDSVPPTATTRFQLVQASLQAAYERGDVGALFDRAAADLEQLRLDPRRSLSVARQAWLYLAWGRLEQLTQAGADPERRERLEQVEQALALAQRGCEGPMMGALHGAAVAAFEQLSGRPRRALRRLDRMSGAVVAQDCPLLEYEIARVRARAHRDLGRAAQARRHAELACQLAQRYGWGFRERWVRSEFDLEGMISFAPRSGAGGDGNVTRGVLVGESRRESRRGAVQQAAVAAARTVDAVTLVRKALTDMVRVFGAERAFLFVAAGEDGTEGVFGRDREGNEPATLTGHGATLVARVRDSGDAVVVIGTEEGEAPGMRIIEPQSLRSILVAPVSLGGQPVGVAYLEGRATEGVFTAEDLDTLAVLTSQVAMSLETARAARADLAVRVAQHRREIAETLRTAMARLSSSLDPAEVCGELVRTVEGLLPDAQAVVLDVDGDASELADDPVLAELLSGEVAVAASGVATSSGPPPRVLGEVAHWLPVPLVVRGRTLALLLLGGDGAPYDDVQVAAVSTVAQQAAAALEIALAHRRSETLSVCDPLTGLPHRQALVESVRDERRSAGDGQQVAAVIVDIDRFRSINDRFGRGVGDEVIREVARRLSAVIRDGDVLCRYGGEEFAVLLADASPRQAEAVARRVHDSVGERRVDTAAGPLQVSVSVGLAVPGGEDTADDTVEGLLRRADGALGDAKRKGRDQVVVSSS